MTDEPTNEEGKPEDEDFGALTGGEGDSDDFGLGSSLPPLSDFDSTEESGDSDLPPLDTPESEGEDEGPISGLPPIVDIKVDTPAVRPSDLDTPEPSRADAQASPTPAGFETPTSDLDSPSPSGLGFQDFAADSDFSPETPEIGPGPDSDIETPMFDSAFGGDSDSFGTGANTSAPTQAMETPMFGSQPEPSTPAADMGGFDGDAFGIPTPDVGGDSGTPVPDFSPDTGAGMAPEAVAVAEGGKAKKKRGGRGPGLGIVGIVINVVLLLVGVVIGVFAGPSMPFGPDPSADEIAGLERQLAQKDRQIADLTRGGEDEGGLSPEQVDELIARRDEAQRNLNDAMNELERQSGEMAQLQNQLALIRADIEEKNNEFVEAQELLEDLKNETAITRARHEGLLSENERLAEMAGELEVANARRQSTKDTLLHNIDLLVVQVQGGSPLTPERYSHAERLARVERLRDKVARAKWVDPQLLDEYTNLYIQELGIGASREYFFARIPVHDRLGTMEYRWAECLMNGNWSVYFQTIDGQHVGSYENTAGSGPPNYEFREDLPSSIRADILQAIEASRVEGYKDKIAVLEGKQRIYETQTDFQRDFSSL